MPAGAGPNAWARVSWPGTGWPGVDVGQPNLRFLQAATENPDWARDERGRLGAFNRERGALYGDEVLPVTLAPVVLSARQRRLLETASRHLMGALDRFVEAFLDGAEGVPAWELSGERRRLFEADPGYEGAVPVARFDGFLDGDRLAFLEFNTDSPAGPGYADVVQRGFEELLDRNPSLGEGLARPSASRREALADALLACYREWRETRGDDRPARPRIAVTDWRDVASRPDSELVVDTLRARGLEARFADPRELTLDGDRLVHEGEVVDLVYKRVIVDELREEPKARSLAEAYRAGAVCMANPPRSVLAGDKRVMALLQREGVQRHLSARQRAAVERFVPWTRVLEPGKTTIEGYTVDLRDFVLDNREKLVLKAASGYGGRDVVLGTGVDAETWGRLVDEHLETGLWVVQRRVPLPETLFPHVDGDDVRIRSLNVNANPFVFGGRFAGTYTRVSAEDVINVAAGGGVAATFTLDEGSGS